MVASERSQLLAELAGTQEALSDALGRTVDRMNQRLDWIAGRLGRPSSRLSEQRGRLTRISQAFQFGLKAHLQQNRQKLQRTEEALPRARLQNLQARQQTLQHMQTRLSLLDPHLVLDRGYAWLTDESGQALTQAAHFHAEQKVVATLADGQVQLEVK